MDIKNTVILPIETYNEYLALKAENAQLKEEVKSKIINISLNRYDAYGYKTLSVPIGHVKINTIGKAFDKSLDIIQKHFEASTRSIGILTHEDVHKYQEDLNRDKERVKMLQIQLDEEKNRNEILRSTVIKSRNEVQALTSVIDNFQNPKSWWEKLF